MAIGMGTKEYLAKIDELVATLKRLQPLKREDEERLWRKFRLEWDYNSNHLEGNTLTYNHTELLVMFDQVTDGYTGREIEEMKAHDVAVRMVKEMASEKDRDLTETFIRQLNETILVRSYYKEAITVDGQPTRKLVEPGKYKTTPNSVRLENGEIFHYASPDETPVKMAELIAQYHQWSDRRLEHPVVVAAVMHYDFVRIHPFDDGNGRVARLIMNYILIRNGLPPVIVKSSDKKAYLIALSKADSGLVNAFVDYISEQLIWSIGLTISAAKGEQIDELDDVDKELDILKRHLNREDEVKFSKNREIILKLWQSSYFYLFEAMHTKLSQFDELFVSKTEGCYVNGGMGARQGDLYNSDINRFFDTLIRELELVNAEGKSSSKIVFNTGEVNSVSYQCIWEGFKKNRSNPFDVQISLEVKFERMKYIISSGGPLGNAFEPFSKVYHEILSKEEIALIVNSSTKLVLKKIKENLGSRE